MSRVRSVDSDSGFPTVYRKFAEEVEKHCSQLRTSKGSSGDGWEALFVLLLLVRCITKMSSTKLHVTGSDALVPEDWFKQSPTISFNAAFSGKSPITSCKNWEELKGGLSLDEGPQISIFYPPHASFVVYDVIVIYSEDKKIQKLYGYQCKQDEANAAQDVHPEFDCSFVLQGESRETSSIRKNWFVPGSKDIDEFFGSSGKLWTPREWRRLFLTLERNTGETSKAK